MELNGLLATAPAYFMKTSAGRIINRLSQVSIVSSTYRKESNNLTQDMLITDLEFPFSLINSVWYIDVTSKPFLVSPNA